MSWIAVAVVGGSALIGAGATIYSSNKASSASNAASQAATTSAQEGMTTEWNMYQQMREDYAPWREAGKNALGDVIPMIEAGPGKFVPQEQPGYEFGFKNFIEKPYLSAQSAKGKRLSGETVKGLTKYAGDYASTSYDNFLERYYKKLNPFLSLADKGQVATGGSTWAGTQYGNALAILQQNAGNAQAQNFLNQGNIGVQTAGALGGIAQGAGQNWLKWNMFNKLNPAPTAPTGLTPSTGQINSVPEYGYT